MLRSTIILLSLLPAVSGLGQSPEKQLAEIKSVEVASGDGYVIHGLKLPGSIDWLPADDRYALLHTSLPAGKLRVLVSAGPVVSYSPPMGVNVTYIIAPQLPAWSRTKIVSSS